MRTKNTIPRKRKTVSASQEEKTMVTVFMGMRTIAMAVTRKGTRATKALKMTGIQRVATVTRVTLTETKSSFPVLV
jgi:hypothetical protein